MQSEIHVRLYEELNDYLPPAKRKHPFAQQVNEGATVQELLELIGVPPFEVDLILVNGESAPLGRVLDREDRVSIYPVFEALDIKPVACVREEPLRLTRFVACQGLDRLCTCLRLLGFDVLDAQTWTRTARVEAAEREKRILLTRDPSLAAMPVSRFYVVQAVEPMRQLIEVIRRLNLQRESIEKLPNVCRDLRPNCKQ